MAGGATKKRGIIAGINVTPLVDITLVLLVVFIVTAKIVVTPAIPMDLPQASQSKDVQMVFSVLLPANGGLLINGTPVTNTKVLETRARAALKQRADLRAVIQADGSVTHRRVIGVLDTLKRAGVKRIAFGTLPKVSAP